MFWVLLDIEFELTLVRQVVAKTISSKYLTSKGLLEGLRW
jgi:hypothetical protein